MMVLVGQLEQASNVAKAIALVVTAGIGTQTSAVVFAGGATGPGGCSYYRSDIKNGMEHLGQLLNLL